VVVDLRVGSATYGQWFMVELNANNGNASSLTIPAQFGHGYYSPGKSTLVHGICVPASEQKEVRFSAFDSELNIQWPFAKKGENQLKMNIEDLTSPPLKQVEKIIKERQNKAPSPLVN